MYIGQKEPVAQTMGFEGTVVQYQYSISGVEQANPTKLETDMLGIAR